MKKLTISDDLVSRLREIINKHGYGSLKLTMVPQEYQIELLEKYPQEIMAWRKFMTEEVYPHPDDHEDYGYDEVDFHDFCKGFMVGKGVPPADAFSLATFMRYNLQDFNPKLNAAEPA